MDSLEYVINRYVIDEDVNFRRSYEIAMYLFSKYNPEPGNPVDYSNIEKVGNNHAVMKLMANGLTSVFYHQLHQPTYILNNIDIDSHYIVLYHHNDMDGYVSAATIADSLSENPQKFIEYNYSDIKPIIDTTMDALVKKEEKQKSLAIIVDLSLPWYANKSGLLSFILETFDQVIWIDHHATSLEVANKLIDYKEWPNLSMFIDTRMSSAMQCKCLLNYNTHTNIHQLVSYYDRKDDRQHPAVYQLGVYLNQYIYDFNMTDPSHLFYKQILALDDLLSQVLLTGENLYSIKNLKDKIMYDADTKYRCDAHDLTIIALNRSGNSKIFTDPLPMNSIKTLIRKVADGKWLFSVYSDSAQVKKMNLGVVMREEYGGGGHPGAAGATITIEDIQNQNKINGLKTEDIDQYITISGPNSRLSKEFRQIFSEFCSVIMNRWIKFKNEEESSK